MTADPITAIAGAITSSYGVGAICVAIFLWAIVAFRWGFKRKLKPMVRQLDAACERLGPAEGEEGFAAAFEELSEAFRENALLKDAWSEFEETLLFPAPGEELQVVRNVHPPGMHFRRDALLGRTLNLRLYNSLPNLLTGTGILGTFLGLVAGIYLASGNLASDDIAKAKEAMRLLLDGASLAFLTSVVGLVTSIVFSWREKHWVHRFDARLGCWIAGLDKRLRRVTPETFARDQLLQSRQQTQVLEAFSDTLAFQIAEALEQRMSQSVAPVMEQLVEEIRGLRQDRDSTNQAVLERLIERFSDSVQGAAGTELQDLASTLSQLNAELSRQFEAAEKRHSDNQAAAEDSMDRLGELFRSGAEDFQGRVSQSVETITGRLGGLLDELSQQQQRAAQAAEQQLAAISQTFEQAMSGLKGSLEDIRRVNADSRAVVEKVDALVAGLDRAREALEGTAEPLRGAAERFTAAGGQVEAASGRFEQIQGRLSESVEHLVWAEDQVRQAWADYEQRFAGVDESLADAFTRLQEGIQRYSESVKEFVAGLDRHTGDIVGKLGGAVSEFSEAVEDLGERLGRGR